MYRQLFLFFGAFVFVSVLLWYVNRSLIQTLPALNPTPMPTPHVVDSNPQHFPIDQKTGTILLPTNSYTTSRSGAIHGLTSCDQLHSVLNCYGAHNIALLDGYESYTSKDIYKDLAPPARQAACNKILEKLTVTRQKAHNSGCVW
jgi:hypothetical protein